MMDNGWIRASGVSNSELPALERWVQEALTARYGPVAEEALPEQWVAMLDGEAGDKQPDRT